MTRRSAEIRPFDPSAAPVAELAAVHALSSCLRTEHWPEDPPRSRDDFVRELRAVPSFVVRRMWVAWHGGEAVGVATLTTYDTPDNRHAADADIGVAPPWRRRGIAKRLLAHIVAGAKAQGRTLLLASTDSAVPAGAAFMERLGARVGLVSRTNQLDLAGLDRGLLRAWQDRAPRDEFELGWWIGPYPEEDLAAVCALKEVMNTAPRDSLEVEDWHLTPEMVREQEAALAVRKVERWTLCARHRASGELAGYTEVFWDPSQPDVLWQGDTGVRPKYRGHGLGRWLKAAMAEKAVKDRPQVKRIRTGNANSNAAMLKINYEMGFRPYKDWTLWQVEVERVREYLGLAG